MLPFFSGVSSSGGGHGELAAELLCSVEARAVARCWVTREEEEGRRRRRSEGRGGVGDGGEARSRGTQGREFFFSLVWFFRLSNVRKKKRSRERPRMRRIERVRDGEVAVKERGRVE